MPLPEYHTGMTLVEVPGRREVELTINNVHSQRNYLNDDPLRDLTYTLYYDMTADIPQDLNPAYYWAMVLSYVVRIDEGAPRTYAGGMGPRCWTTEWLDNDQPIPIRWWVLPGHMYPDGIYDPYNIWGESALHLGHDPTQGPSPIVHRYLTRGSYGWGRVQVQSGPPPVYEIRDGPPPTVERGAYEVYYEPGMSFRHFGRYMLFWETFQTGESAGGVSYDITDRKFEATLQTQFSPVTISSNPVSASGYVRPRQVRILAEQGSLVDPWNLSIEDKRVIFIPYAGPSIVNPALGPEGTVRKRRGVSGDRRR